MTTSDISAFVIVNCCFQNVEPSPTFLEKQLLALHISLKLEVDEEKRKVTQLLGVLRQVRSLLPEDALRSFDANHAKNQLSDLQTPTDPMNQHDLTEMEQKRDELLAEIAKYRDLCGLLRARLEQYNLLLSSAQKEDAVAASDASESVVTRF
uniref:Mediator of RNA polymerase II transcription subunit 9 n=1 Tax=Bursaphelenchus xylophilus TaxID=6326 RepID=A0A1I7RVA6_BURXY